MCHGGCWRKQVVAGALVYDGSWSRQLGCSARGTCFFAHGPTIVSRLLVRQSNTMGKIRTCHFVTNHAFCFGKFEPREHFTRISHGRPRTWHRSRHKFCTSSFYVRAAQFLSQDHSTHRAFLTTASISSMAISISCCVHVGTTSAICEFCKVESVQAKVHHARVVS